MKNINDAEVADFAEFTRDRAVDVRFIEYMPFDGAQAEALHSLSAFQLFFDLSLFFYVALRTHRIFRLFTPPCDVLSCCPTGLIPPVSISCSYFLRLSPSRFLWTPAAVSLLIMLSTCLFNVFLSWCRSARQPMEP